MYIAIDGGGTKTEYLLLDNSGTVLVNQMGFTGKNVNQKELDYIIDYIRKDKDNLMPTFHSFAEKNEIDPYIVTKKIKKDLVSHHFSVKRDSI